MAEERDRSDNCTVKGEIEVAKEQITNFTDYQSLENLAHAMVKAAMDCEEVVILTWPRDEALRLAGVLHRLRSGA